MIGLVDGNNFFVSCERVVDPSLEGRAVAVLSNNDGCCVSRSNEFKALGIAMGTPYFQLRDRERRGECVFRSSNYELYGDISRRIISILRDEALDVEQYSIDEAFVYPPNLPDGDLAAYGARLRKKILRWVGVPCGVGFAPTKTLAKIANHIGKKLPDGVFVLPEDPTDILRELPAGEVWGVGRRLVTKLRSERIFTALDLRDAPDAVLRGLGGVVLVRTAIELRGIVASQDRDYDADPDSVSCSRSFGEPVTTLEALGESLASFTAQAAVKLRRHRLRASGCNIYAQRCQPGCFDRRGRIDDSFVGRTVVFAQPTDATNEMLAAIRPEVSALFAPGLRYRKSGVVFFGLEKVGAPRQGDLFGVPDAAQAARQEKNGRLFAAIDALNQKLGRGSVATAAEGLGEDRAWKMKRALLSRRATTRWEEIPTVR